MALDQGASFGPFVLTGPLGAGGMGEVYRATDTNLKRDVAIKILPRAFVNDADRVARFQREAEILGSLSHPNIAQVHGLERGEGATALVMELVEGPTLAERIADGPVPVDEALNIAMQIADALESAHSRGVVHRDLKPANVKLTAEGRVKVLDFGLAKIVAGPETTASPSGAPGRAGLTTEPGVIFGTPAYMSPEQVRGGAVDKRTDLWAFACVLFELLTGQPAFQGKSNSDVYASVLNGEPDWSLLPAHTPPSVRLLLRRCLRKSVDQRMRDLGDARLELAESGDDQAVTAPARSSRSGLGLAALGLAIVAGATILAVTGRFGTAERDEFRFELSTPATAAPEQFAVSPDGSTVALVGQSADGASRLWLKEIGTLAQRELAGTDDAAHPFWSADGRSVSFYADGKLKKYDLTAERVQVLDDNFGVQQFLGGTWNAEGVLLFTPSYQAPILTARFGPQGPSYGGPVTSVDVTRETGHLFPHFLPDGNHFLYYVNGRPEVSGTYIGSLDRSVEKRLMPSDSTAVYSEPGRLLFVRDGRLHAQSFDLESLTVSGEAFVVTDAPVLNVFASGGVSASTEGTIVYRTGIPPGRRQFVWRDDQGRELERVAEPIDGGPGSPELTSNADGIVFHRIFESASTDLWLLEFSRGAPSRITFEASNQWNVIVSPVDDTLIYANYTLNEARREPTQLYSRPLSSNALPGQLLLGGPVNLRPMAYSADGRTILYGTEGPAWDIWALSLGSGETLPVTSSEANEWNAQFSPDMNWVAFESDESGIVEVYLQSYPDGRVKKKVSSNGGAQPRWFSDGAEQYLYFVGLDRMLNRTQLVEGAEPRLVSFGPVQPLFLTNIGPVAPQDYIRKQQYLVDSRGRILTNEPPASSDALRVVRHWAGEPTPD